MRDFAVGTYECTREMPNYARTRTSSRTLTNPCTSSSASKPRIISLIYPFPQRTRKTQSLRNHGRTGIIMHQTDPHHTLIPQRQIFLHKPLAVKMSPPTPVIAPLLDPLHDRPAPLALDRKTDHRNPHVGVGFSLPIYRHVGSLA